MGGAVFLSNAAPILDTLAKCYFLVRVVNGPRLGWGRGLFLCINMLDFLLKVSYINCMNKTQTVREVMEKLKMFNPETRIGIEYLGGRDGPPELKALQLELKPVENFLYDENKTQVITAIVVATVHQ